MTDQEAETARAALYWRDRYETLWDAIDEYRLWQPGRRGHAAALRKLERVWRGDHPEDDE